MQAIETLLFDFGGTLDADGVAWKDRFRALYQGEGLNLTDEAFAPAFYAADNRLVGNLAPAAGLTETVHALASNLEEELAKRRARAGRATEPSDSGRGRRLAKRFLSETSAIFVRNRPILERLAARYRLGVVSNFYGNLEAVCRSSGVAPLVKVMADSHCIGAEKPDPAIFRAALDALHAEPETTLFVGDSMSRDCEGAYRAGLGFIWIAPEAAHAEICADERPPVLAALTALPELLNILK
jgi:FMN phosphatase YigB (HAD superfamily)